MQARQRLSRWAFRFLEKVPSLGHYRERKFGWRVESTTRTTSGEDAMSNLIIQDTFDPYYAGREDDSLDTNKRPAAKQQPKARDVEIVLPSPLATPVAIIRRRDRRAIAH